MHFVLTTDSNIAPPIENARVFVRKTQTSAIFVYQFAKTFSLRESQEKQFKKSPPFAEENLMTLRPHSGFTLAELLIALAILGVIATFTIPKVLSSQQDSRYKAIAKEVAGMVSGAYQAYQYDTTVQTSTGFKHLTPYMNYVRLDSVTKIDDDYGSSGTDSCGAANRRCLMLHNGAALYYKTNESFGGTQSTSVIWFRVDPDGKVTSDGLAGGPGRAAEFGLYINGRLVDSGHFSSGTESSLQGYSASPSEVPPWFSWN